MTDLSVHTCLELGTRLRNTRARHGFHHRAAAQLAGLSAQQWIQLESGLRTRWASLTLAELARVCAAVHTHPAVLFLGM
jgi:transcriptional regulator with XRE-family HTH domain